MQAVALHGIVLKTYWLGYVEAIIRVTIAVMCKTISCIGSWMVEKIHVVLARVHIVLWGESVYNPQYTLYKPTAASKTSILY